MEQSNRVLVVHSNPEKSRELGRALQNWGHFQVKCIHGGLDGVTAFEWFRPMGVIIEFTLADLPVNALADAFQQMNPAIKIVLCGDRVSEAMKRERESLKALAAIALPVNASQVQSLFGGDPEEMDLPVNRFDDQTIRLLPDEVNWGERVSRHEPSIMDAEELNFRKIYSHVGPLRVIGDLRGLNRLEVAGSLVIDGGVEDAAIYCDGPLVVNGRIENCQRGGIFCRGDVDARQIVDSLVVAGQNLWFRDHCLHSRINVVQRLVGKSEKSKLAGGRIRVGEHICTSILGDEHHTATEVELAVDLFHEIWIRNKRRCWAYCKAINPSLNGSKQALFHQHLKNAGFYRTQAELLVTTVYPCVSIKIGDQEEYLFEACREPLRIVLGERRPGKFGICLKRRSKRKGGARGTGVGRALFTPLGS